MTLDSTGSATVRGNGAYHFVLKDATDTTTLWDADNYSILDSSQITYDQTPAEIAAGVTPVSYQYVTNNVFRYLTAAQIANVIAGTLTLDCTAGIQNAINVAAAGFTRLVYFPGGYYLISSPLSLPLGMTAGQMYGEGKITTIKASAGFSGANMLTGAANTFWLRT